MKIFDKPLPESTFIILRDLIHARTGLYYEENKRHMLADKLAARVSDRGLDSFLDYYYLLKYDQAAGFEWQHLMDALAVPETFFWREFDQLEAMVQLLLPALRQQKEIMLQPLRIWSAACSTGEEPLTIAMILNEAGWFHKLPIEIYASDASPRAIAIAREGLYRERSFRSLPLGLQEKYFTKESQGWRISPQIHQRINWRRANLTDSADIEQLLDVNLIFCRNVFIYFSEKSIKKTVGVFWENMRTPGYLFLSASESLLKLKTNFELQPLGEAFVYVKK
ncbi:MAG: protein-glutamate O-methyltransferase CheR [Hormoscilla sp.]